jgi:hypothetical protein
MTASIPTFDSLGGESWRIRRFADPKDPKWSAFNPCVAYSPVDGYVVVFRSSNYFIDPEFGNGVTTTPGRVRSNIWFAKLDKNFEIIESTLRMIDFSESGLNFKRGAEDARLFWRDGAWHFIAGLKEDGIYYPKLGIFKLDSDYKAEFVEVMADGWLNWVEKNWMPPYEQNPNFDFIYGPGSIYKKGLGPIELRDMNFTTKGVRGGSCLWDLGDKTYLALVHKAHMEVIERYNPRVFGNQFAKIRSYTHCFARYDYEGKLISLSPQFVFRDQTIEFGAGLVVSGDDVIVSYGYKDVAAYLGKIKLTKVMEILNDC